MPTATAQTITGNGQSRQVLLGDHITNVAVHVSGTFSAINLTFEGSVDGGLTWFGTDAIRSAGNVVESTSGSLSAAPAYSWDAAVGGYSHFRVRSTAYTSGTQNVYFSCYAGGAEGAPVAALAAGSAAIGTVGLTSIAAGATLIGDIGVQYRADNAGAATLRKVTAAASTNATSVKASAGRVIGVRLSNVTAAFKFFRLYNKASAPTVGTDSPACVIALPPNSHTAHSVEGGIGFSLGIAYAITNLVADLDATAVAANDVVGALIYA